MKKHSQKLLAVLCVGALMAGSALAATAITTKTIQAQFMGIQTVVNGTPVTLKGAGGKTVEPFLYDGDTYIPVRAVGEALGKSVEWDNSSKTLYIGKAPMAESADQLIGYIEGSHPAFALNTVPEAYAGAKENLLNGAAKADCSLYEFTFLAMAYTSSLSDGHTAIWPFGNSAPAALDVSWVADGDKLYLLDKSGKPTETEVTQVGGVSVDRLFACLDTIVPSENQSARDRNRAQWASYLNIIAAYGVKVGEDNSVALTLKTGDKEETRTVSMAQPAQAEKEAVITTKMMGDVFYADFNQCMPGAEMDTAVEALSKAVKNGATKVIIDVRGNGGGDSGTCEALLNAMGMEAPMYGMYLRYSPLAQQQRGYDEDTGSYTFDQHPETAKTNDKIKLVVLTDENTYSSATMLGVFVQDGKLGTVMGRTSANSPNSYGDILSYSLTNGLTGTVSHKQWLRPDDSADPNELKPDVETAIGEDSLQTALAYLKSNG